MLVLPVIPPHLLPGAREPTTFLVLLRQLQYQQQQQQSATLAACLLKGMWVALLILVMLVTLDPCHRVGFVGLCVVWLMRFVFLSLQVLLALCLGSMAILPVLI